MFNSSKLTNHKSSKVVEKHYSHLDSGETKEKKDQIAERFNNLLNGGGKVINLGSVSYTHLTLPTMDSV